MRRRVLAVVVGVVLCLGLAPVPAGADATDAGGTFLDDDGSVHEGMVEALAARGTLRGCNAAGTLVCPRRGLDRAQLASLLARALELPPADRDHFSDDGGVHEDAVNRLATAGIAVGRSDGTFGVAEPVRRGQLATFLARALDLEGRPTGPFTDVAGVHAPNINAAAHAGITTGCDATGRRFCPGDVVSRAQAASLVGRAVGATPLVPPPLVAEASTEDWCAAGDRLLRTLTADELALLDDYEPWALGPGAPTGFPAGALPLRLYAVSPFSGDPVVAGWDPVGGLVTSLADPLDIEATYPVVLTSSGDGWSCEAVPEA